MHRRAGEYAVTQIPRYDSAVTLTYLQMVENATFFLWVRLRPTGFVSFFLFFNAAVLRRGELKAPVAGNEG